MSAAPSSSRAAVALGRDRLGGRMLAHAFLLLGAGITLLPLLWMILTSIRPPDEVFSAGMSLLPKSFHAAENYGYALNQAPLLRYMLNGAIVCAIILFCQLLVAIPAAYALAKLSFAARPLVFGFVLLALTIPIQVPAIPLYIAFSSLGLLNTYFALCFPFMLSVFGIFLFRQFIKTFPTEIIQAARVDGFSEIEIVTRIIVPSLKPAIAAFAVFSITAHWNDLYWPLIVTTSPDHATPPLGMLQFRDQETGSNYGALMAGAAVITAPLVIAFLVAQRQFIQGITMTGLK